MLNNSCLINYANSSCDLLIIIHDLLILILINQVFWATLKTKQNSVCINSREGDRRVDLTNKYEQNADIHYIIYIQLTEYHESCSHTTATNNSRSTSNSNRFWVDRWNGRHEPATTQYTRHTEVFNIHHWVRELCQSEGISWWRTLTHCLRPPYWRVLWHSSVTVTLAVASCRHLANNVWVTKEAVIIVLMVVAV